MNSDRMCKIKGKNEFEILIPLDAARLSLFLSNALDLTSNQVQFPEISLSDIDNNTLEKVVEFCIKHKDSPMDKIEAPLQNIFRFEEVVSVWDAEFIDVELDALIALIKASFDLKIESLISLSCAKMAFLLREKNNYEIRETFGIRDESDMEEVILRNRERNKEGEEF